MTFEGVRTERERGAEEKTHVYTHTKTSEFHACTTSDEIRMIDYFLFSFFLPLRFPPIRNIYRYWGFDKRKYLQHAKGRIDKQ